MKKIVAFVCLSLLLMVSCTQYQFITLDSDIYKEDQGGFVWENDTVKIQYAFSGRDCPLTIQIYNKLKDPIYVDWSKSAVVYSDGSAFPLWSDQSVIKTGTTGAGVNLGNMTFSSSETNGAIERAVSISFIPPSSFVSLRPMYVRSNLIRPLPAELKKHIPFGNEEFSKVDMYDFTQNNNPFSFRCFLTLSADKGFTKPMYVDQNFWTSSIIETKRDPSTFLQSDYMFYVSKTTNTGHFLQGVGVATLAGGAIYIDAKTSSPSSARH